MIFQTRIICLLLYVFCQGCSHPVSRFENDARPEWTPKLKLALDKYELTGLEFSPSGERLFLCRWQPSIDTSFETAELVAIDCHSGNVELIADIEFVATSIEFSEFGKYFIVRGGSKSLLFQSAGHSGMLIREYEESRIAFAGSEEYIFGSNLFFGSSGGRKDFFEETKTGQRVELIAASEIDSLSLNDLKVVIYKDKFEIMKECKPIAMGNIERIKSRFSIRTSLQNPKNPDQQLEIVGRGKKGSYAVLTDDVRYEIPIAQRFTGIPMWIDWTNDGNQFAVAYSDGLLLTFERSDESKGSDKSKDKSKGNEDPKGTGNDRR